MTTPTPSELAILHILWRKKEATAHEVHEQLNREKTVGYTGTLKLLQLMHQKNLLTRRREGRSHIYIPAISENKTKSSLLDRFIDNTFAGSAGSMMMQLLGNKKVSERELKEIRDFLNNIEEDK